MEVLNDVLAPARSSRIGRGERQKRKDAWEAAAPCERHPGILNSCHAEELSASALNRPSVRREQPARPQCRLSQPSTAQQRRPSRGDPRSQQARCLWSRSWRRGWRPSNPAWSSLLWLKRAIAVFACTGARCADQERTLGQRPFSGRLVPKCHAKSDVPSPLASLEKEAKSSSVN